MVVTAALFPVLMVMVVAAAFFPVLVVMVVTAALFPVPVMVLMVVMMPVIVAVVMSMLLFPVRQHLLHQLLFQFGAVLDGGKDFFSVQPVDGRGDQSGPAVVLPDQIHRLLHLRRACHVRPAQDDGSRVLDLVDEKLAEILHVHPAFGGVHHRDRAVQGELHVHVFHRLHHIGKLAYAGGLDQNAVRMIGLHHFLQGGSEISHQGTADAAGIHLPDLDPGFLQESAVDADLPELVFDQNHLASGQSLLQKLPDQRSLSRSQKA